MGFFQTGFGKKVGKAALFGTKVIGKAASFGSKVTGTVAKGAGWLARNSDRVLNLAEVIPGVKSLDGGLRSAVNAAQGIANSAQKASDILAMGAGVAGKIQDTIEKAGGGS
jgi:hypothetical protein